MTRSKESNFRWTKLGNVASPEEPGLPSWINDYIQAPNSIVHKDFVRVYFCTREQKDNDGRYVSRVAFFDTGFDGSFTEKKYSESPILNLGSLGEFDEFGTYPFSALKLGEKVIAAYGGWTRSEATPFDVSIGMATSDSQGINFQRIALGPILTKSLNEPFVISSPKLRFFNGKYYLFYIAGTKWIPTDSKPDPIYRIRCATSDNGIDWTKLDRNIVSSILSDEAQASPDVIYFGGVYHMFFCYRHGIDFRDNDRGYRMGYAYSNDLLNWTRDDQRSDLTISEYGWDSESVSYPHVFEYMENIYMLYLGNGIGRTGIGIAKLEQG